MTCNGMDVLNLCATSRAGLFGLYTNEMLL